ncbi:MAG: hypothetical protein NZ561_06275 [Phycisphaerae bacterium]|nr:hypothetical protein [Phycisphaerae bacterium]MDW8263263.1 hypothetical protein [Phycisphaerales bacterium]
MKSNQHSTARGLPLGEILIEQGVLTRPQVEHLLKVQQTCPRPIGDLAERLYGVAPSAIEDAWVEQYLRTVGVVDLNDLAIEVDCLRLLNRRQAWQFHMLPANRQTGELNVATDADSLVRAVNFSTRKLDEPVLFLIAERQQLREFLARHYPVPDFMQQFAQELR